MIRRRLRAVRYVLGAPGRRFAGWWRQIPDQGQVEVAGLALIAVGFLPLWSPQPAAILPGIVLAATGLGFTLSHPIVVSVTVAALAVVAVTTLVVR